MKNNITNTINKPYTPDEVKDYISESSVSTITKLILEKGMYDLLVDYVWNEDLLETLNDSNHKFFLENYTKIPKGLEKKIQLFSIAIFLIDWSNSKLEGWFFIL